MTNSDNDDYCPIVDESELEKPTGVLGRVRRRQHLPPMRQGCERVVLDDKNAIVAGGADLTAGEKYWASSVRVVSVDVGEHILHCSVTQQDPSLFAGFNVLAAIGVRVRNSVEVVRGNIRSVKRFLLPAYENAVRVGSEGGQSDITTNDELATLHNARRALESRLRERLMRDGALAVPTWLSAQVSSISVSFDKETAVHVADLEREVKRAKVDQLNREAAFAKRQAWREQLAGMLNDPATRALEMMLDDPTPKRIEAAADRLDDLDRTHRAEVFDVLKNAMDRHYVTNLDEIKSIRILLESFGTVGGAAPQREITEEADATHAEDRRVAGNTGDEDEAIVEDPKDWTDLS